MMYVREDKMPQDPLYTAPVVQASPMELSHEGMTVVDSAGDHRMAMLFALAGTLGAGTHIEQADSVSISYPSFWSDLAQLSGA